MMRTLAGILLVGTACLLPVSGEALAKDRTVHKARAATGLRWTLGPQLQGGARLNTGLNSGSSGAFSRSRAPALTVNQRTLMALEELAGKGSARAQYELAQRYDAAKGVPRDARSALALYCKAARQGHAEAAEHAGRLLIKGGGGITADEELGRAWLQRAKSGGAAPERCAPPRVRFLPHVISAPPTAIRAMVAKMAPQYGLDPDLVLAVIAVESAFRADVVSSKNAMGLMQLIPETAARFGVSNPFDPQQNLRGGMLYLRWLLAYFEGDVTLALAGYNAGEGAVLQYHGVPPYAETQDYVVKVHSLYKFRRHPYDATVTRAADLPAPKKEVVAELSYTTSSASALAVRRPQPKRASMDD